MKKISKKASKVLNVVSIVWNLFLKLFFTVSYRQSDIECYKRIKTLMFIRIVVGDF